MSMVPPRLLRTNSTSSRGSRGPLSGVFIMNPRSFRPNHVAFQCLRFNENNHGATMAQPWLLDNTFSNSSNSKTPPSVHSHGWHKGIDRQYLTTGNTLRYFNSRVVFNTIFKAFLEHGLRLHVTMMCRVAGRWYSRLPRR